MITTEQIMQAANQHAEAYQGEPVGIKVRSRNAFISGADWAIQHHDKWIPVQEGLPESDTLVILWTNAGRCEGEYVDGEWLVNGEVTERNVTHWRPFPEPPK